MYDSREVHVKRVTSGDLTKSPSPFQILVTIFTTQYQAAISAVKRVKTGRLGHRREDGYMFIYFYTQN